MGEAECQDSNRPQATFEQQQQEHQQEQERTVGQSPLGIPHTPWLPVQEKLAESPTCLHRRGRGRGWGCVCVRACGALLL